MRKVSLHVVHYAAQECAWQHSGERSVARMIEAYVYAHRCRKITVANILRLGRLVEPEKNCNGLRWCGVQVGNDVKLDPSLVPEALKSLVENQPEHPTENDCVEWFRQYEEIHPFRDGNGRTGSLLYNWLRGSLDEPIHAPNLWYDSRRDYQSYPQVEY